MTTSETHKGTGCAEQVTGDATTVVITFPTDDAAERFIFLTGQLGQLTKGEQMRLLPLAVAIRDFLRLATSTVKLPGKPSTGTLNKL